MYTAVSVKTLYLLEDNRFLSVIAISLDLNYDTDLGSELFLTLVIPDTPGILTNEDDRQLRIDAL